jgi:hypothetical protein
VGEPLSAEIMESFAHSQARLGVLLIGDWYPPDPLGLLSRRAGWRFLQKPFNAEELTQAVESVLRSSATHHTGFHGIADQLSG